ncbi:hypothetical protein [Kitasatospora albolonga]|uniref:hypothetical protein n=1 Tax=Kitasatospora albolonga TaxID=68173 RepID=UPI0031EE85F3
MDALLADLAWLSGGHSLAVARWTSVALARAGTEGSDSPQARFAARQAAAAWKHVPDASAADVGRPLLAMLLQIAPLPEVNPIVRTVRRRVEELD